MYHQPSSTPHHSSSSSSQKNTAFTTSAEHNDWNFIPPAQHQLLHQHPQSTALLGRSIAAPLHYTSQHPLPPPMTSFFAMPDGGQSHSSKPPRRRRSAAGAEPVKHRRTRSGCFTCRMRRVKCDETHPICERCQKGGRECTYPEVIPTPKSATSQRKRDKPSNSREGSSSLEDLEEEDDEYGDDVISPQEGPRLKKQASSAHVRGGSHPRRDSWPSNSDHGRRRRKHTSEASASPHDLDSSVPTSPADSNPHSRSIRRTASSYSIDSSQPDWGHLPNDVAFYLNYHRKMLTCHHYLLKHDDQGFFKTTLFEYAMSNEALLYAVAAFSSFHYSVNFKTGAFQTFLEYYNRSVALLRVSLDPDHERNITTIITILQLASFEEYLGDWMSLMEHRNAASKILISLWTPETMAETDELRMVYNWFIHFDVIASMMAGHQTALDREWSVKNRDAVLRHLQVYPDDLSARIENTLCLFRELAVSAAIMTAERASKGMTMEEFLRDSRDMLQRCDDWWTNLDPLVTDGRERITIPAESPSVEEPCPFTPALLYKGTKWPVNFIFLDYYALIILLKHQIALTNNTGPEPSLSQYAIKICEILAALELYPGAPTGALLATQAALGLAALWVPNHGNNRKWLQKQLAKVEQMGFIYPLAFRKRMAELWGNPRLENTWVTDESDTAMGLTIRRLVDERDAETPYDPKRADIKEMRSLMREMRLDSKGSGKMPKSLVIEKSPVDDSDMMDDEKIGTPNRGEEEWN